MYWFVAILLFIVPAYSYASAILKIPTVDELVDVNASSPANGEVLKFNSTSGKWENSTDNAKTNLNSLDDVSITSPTDGQVLTFDGATSTWKNAAGGGGGGGGGTSFRGALLKKTGDTNIPTNTGVLIPFDAEEFDTDNFHDNVTNNTRITIPSGVSYVRLCGAMAITGGVANDYDAQLLIIKNGLAVVGAAGTVTSPNAPQDLTPEIALCTAPLNVAAGDYFELRGFQTSGATLAISANPGGLRTRTYFSIEIVGGGGASQLNDSSDVTISTPTNDDHLVYDSGAGVWQNKGFQGALVRLSANVNVANNTFTSIGFDTEEYDDGNWHDNITNNTRLTVPSGVSKVRVCVAVTFAQNTVGQRVLRVLKNGLRFNGMPAIDANPTTGDDLLSTCSGVLKVTAGDYFEMNVLQNSGAGLDVLASPTNSDTWFSIEAVR